ncbi:MAG: hypothetical protein RL385_2001 [Pseudomonadota bacterium]|jgi:hypothetical protein
MHLPRLGRHSKLIEIASGILVAVALYALIGFELLPRLVASHAKGFVAEHYRRALRVDAVRFDPFALRLELDGLYLPDREGAPMLGLEHAVVDFEALRSLWERAYYFRRIELARPMLHAGRRSDGSVNLEELLLASAGDSKDSAPPPAVWVELLQVRAGSLVFTDKGRDPAFEEKLSPLSFELRHFRNTAAGGAFSLSAITHEGARLWWKGTFALAPKLSSKGRFTLAGFPLKLVTDYLGSRAPLAISSGALGLTADYAFSLARKLSLTLDVPTLTAQQVELHTRNQPQDTLALTTLQLANVHADLDTQRLDVDRVSLLGVDTRLVRERDGSFNLQRMFTLPRASAPAQTALPVAASAASTWQVHVGVLDLAGKSVALEDRAVTPPHNAQLGQLALHVQDITQNPSRPLPVTLALTLDGRTRLEVGGKVTPSPLAAALHVDLRNLQLADLHAYTQAYAKLKIREGALSLAGTLDIAAESQGKQPLVFAGDLHVRNFQSDDLDLGQPLLSWQELGLTGIHVQSTPPALHVAQVRWQKPFARVVLSQKQALNLASIVPPSRNAKSVQPGGAPPLDVQVRSVVVDKMRLSFTDHFIRPNFSVEAHDVRGTFNDLSTRADTKATLDLRGTLGESSPLRISGKLHPFDYTRATDIALAWSNVPLAVFNPYSGRFAGYKIDRGDLASTLTYKVRNGSLAAQHHIRLDQLTWGDATETKESATLPVRLATALLRDRHGVITLDVPVSGKLSDPTFRLGPLVWQVAKNIMVRAVTAPFDWIGTMFAGAEKARFVDFAPGESTLTPAAKAQLAALAAALEERPSLSVDVPLGVVAARDRSALIDKRYEALLRQGIRAELAEKHAQTPFADLALDDQEEVLEALYKQLTGKSPKLPEAPKAEAGRSFRERRALRRAFAVNALAQLTRAQIQVDDGALDQLGLSRADAIELALEAEGKIDDTRVLVSTQGNVTDQQGKVRFELALH